MGRMMAKPNDADRLEYRLPRWLKDNLRRLTLRKGETASAIITDALLSKYPTLAAQNVSKTDGKN